MQEQVCKPSNCHFILISLKVSCFAKELQCYKFMNVHCWPRCLEWAIWQCVRRSRPIAQSDLMSAIMACAFVPFELSSWSSKILLCLLVLEVTVALERSKLGVHGLNPRGCNGVGQSVFFVRWMPRQEVLTGHFFHTVNAEEGSTDCANTGVLAQVHKVINLLYDYAGVGWLLNHKHTAARLYALHKALPPHLMVRH